MSEQAPVVMTVRPEVEQLRVTGPAAFVIQRVVDHRVVVAVHLDPGSTVVREGRQ